MDDVAVRDDAAVFLIDPNGAFESAVNRIPAQQISPFRQIIIRALAHDDGTQTQLISTAGLLYQEPRQETANPSEAVQHDVLRPFQGRHVAPDDLGAFPFDEAYRRCPVGPGFLHEADRQFPDIDVGRAEVELRQRLQYRIALELRQFVVLDLAHVPVRRHQLRDALVVQRLAVTVGHDVVSVEAPDNGNHRFGQCFAFFPIGEVVVETW